MRRLFYSLFRLTALVAAGLTLLAVLLSRMVPAEPERSPVADRRVLLDGSAVEWGADSLWILDPDNGRDGRISLPEGDNLEKVCVSPWLDGRGRWQAVGLGWQSTGRGSSKRSEGFTLVRQAFPGGERLNSVNIEILPSSAPSWLPGNEARIVFAGGDGVLYGLTFEGSPRDDAVDGCDPSPGPLVWKVAPPFGGQFFVCDTSSPRDPRMTRTLLASIRPKTGAHDPVPLSRVYWLRLNAEGTAVVAAGPLTRPERNDEVGNPYEESRPALAIGPDGNPVMAYLVYQPGQYGFKLRVADLSLDASTGDLAPASPAPPFNIDCLRVAPVFSGDGSWISIVARTDETHRPSVRRLAVKDLDHPRIPSG